jgi:hypothetical protein
VILLKPPTLVHAAGHFGDLQVEGLEAQADLAASLEEEAQHKLQNVAGQR